MSNALVLVTSANVWLKTDTVHRWITHTAVVKLHRDLGSDAAVLADIRSMFHLFPHSKVLLHSCVTHRYTDSHATTWMLHDNDCYQNRCTHMYVQFRIEIKRPYLNGLGRSTSCELNNRAGWSNLFHNKHDVSDAENVAYVLNTHCVTTTRYSSETGSNFMIQYW